MMDPESLNYHEDVDLFRDALTYTQSETGFTSRLVEKDYYCTLALIHLSAIAGPPWALKGGTCLSKVHSEFCRMSEDLDFACSVASNALRAHRSKLIAPMKPHFSVAGKRSTCFQVAEPLRGFNKSTQYIGSLGYTSLVTGQVESIKVEFGMREPILEPLENLPARTLLIDPFRRAAAIAPVKVLVLSRLETYAEKLRAALTRRDPAIRDFYDVDYGVRSGRLKTSDGQLIDLVRAKLAVPDNDPVDMSGEKYAALDRQVEAQLRPVLREADYADFDLRRAFNIVDGIAIVLQ
jgi:predicted nucleotidyltransferase component of viral defense system